MTMSCNRHAPIFDIHPVTGASIEIFYADRTLESFGRNGAGWFWWQRQRGFAPDVPAVGPFPTSYSAYKRFPRPTQKITVRGINAVSTPENEPLR